MAGLNQAVVASPTQTHEVFAGRLRIGAYQDGSILRATEDGRQLAYLTPEGKWSRPVKVSVQRPLRPWDLIKPKYPAQEVHLEKGRYY